MRNVRALLLVSAKKLVHALGLKNHFIRFLYHRVHNLERAFEFRLASTQAAFSQQWTNLPDGEYLLTDPWFRENVDRIISEQEVLIDRRWFKNKQILDAGCGNGRWAYGFSKLGAILTCVDQAESALESTRQSLLAFENPKTFIHSKLEKLGSHIAPQSFDLVFSWGVIHHCQSYNKALSELAAAVKPGGLIYLYLYGRESLPLEADYELFKKRLLYNVFMNENQRREFLLEQAGNDPKLVHNQHDIYAPLINRRFAFEDVQMHLENLGFTNVVRTIDHTEVFVRATKGSADYSDYELPARKAPYWFQGHHI